MAGDTKVSLLTAVATVAATDELPVNQGGVSKKITVDQIGIYNRARASVTNASVTTPAAGFAADTYLVGSSVAVPATSGSGSLKATSQYRCKFYVSKTGAGTAAPVVTIRFGTGAAVTDTSVCALTFAAQTGVIDEGFIEVFATFRTVGSGTSAVIQGVGTLAHRLAATGLSTSGTSVVTTTGTGFNSTTASSIIGCSVNGGTSAAWTITLVQSELFALA